MGHFSLGLQGVFFSDLIILFVFAFFFYDSLLECEDLFLTFLLGEEMDWYLSNLVVAFSELLDNILINIL